VAKQSWPGLGSLQAEVMDFVWAREEATVAEVHEQITARRKVTYTTVLAAMQKLEKKGWLKHRQRGRAYVYRPVRSRQATVGRSLRDLVKHAFEGDPKQLLVQLLDDHPMDEAELNELKKLIDARRKEQRHG